MNQLALGILCLASLVVVTVTQTTTSLLFSADGTFLGLASVPVQPGPGFPALTGFADIIAAFIGKNSTVCLFHSCLIQYLVRVMVSVWVTVNALKVGWRAFYDAFTNISVKSRR